MGQEDIKIKISFIIPAYNCEGSLRRCVESIEKDVQKKATTCEILIVENGSSDKTWDKAQELTEEYSNIKLFKSNKGVSKARNKGIEEAYGEKIIFVDADDEWLSSSCEKILKQDDHDLLMCGYYKGDKQIIHDYHFMNTIIDEPLDNFIAWLLVRPTVRMQVWAKVFNKSVIEQNGLRFDDNLSFSEDSEFLLRYVKCCKTVSIVEFPIYRYSCCGVSAVRSYRSDRQQKYIQSLEATSRDISDASEIVKKAYLEYILAHLNLIAVHDIFDFQIKGSFWEKYSNMKKLIKVPVFKKALKDIPLRKCLTMQLSPEACIKCHLSLVGGVICYVKAFLNHRQQKQISTDNGGNPGS